MFTVTIPAYVSGQTTVFLPPGTRVRILRRGPMWLKLKRSKRRSEKPETLVQLQGATPVNDAGSGRVTRLVS